MPDASSLEPDALLAGADALLPEYRAAIAGMPREKDRQGICASEMFFLYVLAAPSAPGLILESGRARAESTLTLARCFPRSRIISVEFMRDHGDVPLAEAKLRPYRNVELLYGDARECLPPRLETGCFVLIDGPKEFRALKLALRLLATGKPAGVFLHDFGRGTSERAFVERHLPGARFSDEPGFLARYAGVDGDDPMAGKTRHSAFTYLPGGDQRPRTPLPVWLAWIAWTRTRSLAPQKLGRLLGGRREPASGPR